ncbi:MAG: NAD-dependent epimerase/dehydratase family protein [Desulfatitalea sp.]|nr:NAD-dependent epimerase/dehydratase family protein [Desulfatitalea sp.]
MKLLITGICGFAGSTIAREWLASEPETEIFGMDNLIRPGSEINRIEIQKLGAKFLHGDIRMASDFETIPTVDWVIDAAANPSVLAGVDGFTSSRQLVEHNLIGTVNILEYCKRIRAGFTIISTSRVYSVSQLSGFEVEAADRAFKPREEQPLPIGLSLSGIGETFSTEAPISLYGSTKLASETLALEYGEAFDFPVWINRCGVLAGGGQFGKIDQGIFSFWIHSYFQRRPLRYIGFGGNGYQVRDCLHPRDLIPLLRKQIAYSGNSVPRIYNIGGGTVNAMSLCQISEWCAKRFGYHPIESETEIRRFDIPWVVMDSSLAAQTWGWTPETALVTILDEIAHHAERHPKWLELSGEKK